MTDAPPILRLPNWTNSPPGQWRYKVPETGQQFGPFPDHEQLLSVVRSHYKANGYEIPSRETLLARFEAEACARAPGYCGDTSAESIGPMSALGHSFHSALTCLRTLRDHWRNGERVSAELAEARAQTCDACPRKIEISGCMGCNSASLTNTIALFVKSGKTSRDESLRYCSICDCSQKAIIWINRDAKLKNLSKEQQDALPPTCWIVTEGATQ